jgi:hypothetical protein
MPGRLRGVSFAALASIALDVGCRPPPPVPPPGDATDACEGIPADDRDGLFAPDRVESVTDVVEVEPHGKASWIKVPRGATIVLRDDRDRSSDLERLARCCVALHHAATSNRDDPLGVERAMVTVAAEGARVIIRITARSAPDAREIAARAHRLTGTRESNHPR